MRHATTVGIIAAPELAEDIAKDLVETLPKILQEQIEGNTDWKIEMVVDPLTGAAETVGEIFQEATTYRGSKEWDYMICLTDLPIFHADKVVAVDINESLQISLISIPAFGLGPLLKKIEKTVVYTLKEMSIQVDAQDKRDVKTTKLLRGVFPISFMQKVRLHTEETGDLHSRIINTPKAHGNIRLVLGMTFANNPFKMMSSLTSVVAIAFTTGAFGMIFTTMWKLSHLFSNLRLTGITFAAIIGMIIWVSIAQELWESISTSKHKGISKLYNLTTATTLIIAISAYYIVMVGLFLIISLVLIPPDFLAETLELDTTASFIHYLKIAWFASSLSIVAGAIGAGLVNEELIRDSTYGYRQRSRYKNI